MVFKCQSERHLYFKRLSGPSVLGLKTEMCLQSGDKTLCFPSVMFADRFQVPEMKQEKEFAPLEAVDLTYVFLPNGRTEHT